MTQAVEQALRDALAFAESIIDTVRDPLLVLDAELRVVKASREFYRTFQVLPEETQGQLVYDLGNRQWDIPRLRTLLEEILPQNTAFRDYEVEHVFEHIGRKVMFLNARKIYQEKNHSTQILLAIEDVTARRDAEEARRQAEIRFTEMVKNVRDHAIFLTDPHGVITSWNVAAERVIGYTETEVMGRHFSFIFTPADIAAGIPAVELRQAREAGRAEDERWHLRKGGEPFWALGIVTPLRDHDGHLTGFSKILRDITVRKRMEEELRESEGRFRAIADTAPVLMWLNDPQGCVFVNRAYLDFLGLDQQIDVRGYEWAHYIHPDDRETYLTAYRNAAGHRAPFRAECRFRRHDDTYRWMQSVAMPRLTPTGDFLGYTGCTFDIHEERVAVAALRLSEERFRLIVESAQDYAIFTVDLQGRITSWAPGASAVFGWSAAEAIGQPTAMTFTPEDRLAGVPEQELALAARDGSAPDVRWHRRKDGTRVFIEGVTRTLGSDSASGFLKIGQDVTEQRRAQEELQRSHEELEQRAQERTAELVASQARALQAERLATIGQTVTALAHEGRNALQRAHSCLGRLELRQEGRPDELDLTRRARQALCDLERLFDDLRSYAAPMRVDRKACDLAAIWREAWAQLLSRHQHGMARLVDENPGVATVCAADPFRLEQVFTNLFANALEACSAPVQVTITCVEAELGGRPALRLCVRDNGPGFPQERLRRAFEPFQTTKPTGTGLGMAIVKRIIEAHEGTITLGNRDQGGAEVQITLPREQVSDLLG